jgi:hypothetical protein
MKLGDTVKISDKNTNPWGYGVSAYAGMEGIVADVWEDGAFSIKTGTSTLVVPMNKVDKSPKKGIWIWLNGEHIFHKRILPSTREVYQRFYDKILHINKEEFLKRMLNKFLN